MNAELENKAVSIRTTLAPFLSKDDKGKLFVTINTDEAQAIIADIWQQGKKLIEQIEEDHEPERVALHQKWKDKLAEISSETGPIKELVALLHSGLNIYHQRKEREKREAIRLADEAARKEAEKAKAKIEKKIEKAEASGDLEKAETLREDAAMIVPVSIVPEETTRQIKTESGTVYSKKTLEVEVSDPLALIKEIAAGRFPIGCIEFKKNVIKQQVSAYGLESFSGLKITKGSQIQGRTK